MSEDEDQRPRLILCQFEDDYNRARAAGLTRTQPGKVVNGYRCQMCGRALVVSVYAVGIVMHEGGITLCNPCGAKVVEQLGAKPDGVSEIKILPNAAEQLADKGVTVADLIGRKPKEK